MPQAPIKENQPRRRRRLSPKQVERIRRILIPEEGEPRYTVSELAEVLQLDYMTVYSIHRGWSYKSVSGPIKTSGRPLTKMTDARKERIRVLHARGATYPALAKACGVSESTIKRICKEDT